LVGSLCGGGLERDALRFGLGLALSGSIVGGRKNLKGMGGEVYRDAGADLGVY